VCACAVLVCWCAGVLVCGPWALSGWPAAAQQQPSISPSQRAAIPSTWVVASVARVCCSSSITALAHAWLVGARVMGSMAAAARCPHQCLRQSPADSLSCL
jgi:hypothetical protein